MTAALIFRGHSFRKPNDGYSARAHGIDWRKCIDSQRLFLIEPLKAKYDLHVLLCCYSTEFDQQIMSDYDAHMMQIARPGATQKQTALYALEMATTNPPYDFVVMTRFDLEFTATPWEQPGFDPDKINFLWREWNEISWADHRRCPDAIHMLPGSLIEGFRCGIANTPSEGCLHLVYWPIARELGEDKINIMNPEGFHDSNTDHDANPIYKMVRIP